MGGVAAGRVPGADADRPQDIPRQGWWQILRRAWAEAAADQVPLLAAGVAFYSFLSIFPALVATVLVYGLVSDPAQVTAQVQSVAAALPASAQQLLASQLQQLASVPRRSLSLGVVGLAVVALWSASAGVSGLITAINTAYDVRERRGFVRHRLLALALTLGAIVFGVVAIGLVAVAPVVLQVLGLPPRLRVLLEVARWAGLLGAVMTWLAVLYRVAPTRERPRFRWTSVGAAFATVLAMLASFGFSVYVDNFASYGRLYGSLTSVVVLMLWLWIISLAILLGAEINAEVEKQTGRHPAVVPQRPDAAEPA
jgi:membrane protein